MPASLNRATHRANVRRETEKIAATASNGWPHNNARLAIIRAWLRRDRAAFTAISSSLNEQFSALGMTRCLAMPVDYTTPPNAQVKNPTKTTQLSRIVLEIASFSGFAGMRAEPLVVFTLEVVKVSSGISGKIGGFLSAPVT